MIEQVHAETYSLLIETYVRDSREKAFLFNGMQTSEYSSFMRLFRLTVVPVIKKKADWAMKYITEELVSCGSGTTVADVSPFEYDWSLSPVLRGSSFLEVLLQSSGWRNEAWCLAWPSPTS
jgi:hypothetical protein